MANLNIYKIDNTKHQEFLTKLNATLEQKTSLIKKVTMENSEEIFGFTLYLPQDRPSKEVNWRWILDAFNEQTIEAVPQPKGIVLVEHAENWYAATFGSAFFIVDQFCDREYGFAFARKQKLLGIKTTALHSPNSRRNKIINIYIDYDELEFDSGESFAKLKAKIDFDNDNFSLFNSAIEIGSSIRISTEQESLDTVAKIILYIDDIINLGQVCNKIPVFSKVKDESKVDQLENELKAAVLRDPACLNISELDIVGVTEIFNNNDGQFVLKYGFKKKNVSTLSLGAIKEFCDEYNLSFSAALLDIKVVSLKDGNEVRTNTIHNLIDYTSETDKCVLAKGKWYICNDDYINYLSDSIAEIDVEYNPKYDFSRQRWENYVEQKIGEEGPALSAQGMSEDKIAEKIRKKYYNERAFNNWRQEQDGFQNYDRENSRVNGMNIETMDLYCNGTVYAVKIGKSSGKLCYVVDQSLSALKMWKHGELPFPNINTVAIWMILEREKQLSSINDRPNIDDLKMLSLKIKLDQWKKEVRLQGLKPIIYINYVVD